MLISFEDEDGLICGLNPDLVKALVADERPGLVQIQLLGEDNSITVKGEFWDIFETINWSKDHIRDAAFPKIHAGKTAR